MARKSTTTAAKKTNAAKSSAPVVEVTPVRHSSAPPKAVEAAPAPKAAPTYEAIALAAFVRWQKFGGSEIENWVAAERELSAI